MTRTRFTKKLVEIRMMVVTMHETVEQAIRAIIPILHEVDLEKAAALRRDDAKINMMEGYIFDLCANLIATEQPVARDLRRIIAAMKIVSDLERMGDYAANIAKQMVQNPHSLSAASQFDFSSMIEQGLHQLSGAVESYVTDDAEEARTVAAEDEKLNDMLKNVMEQVIGELSGQNAAQKEEWLQVAIISRYLERFGDHATNICEWTLYSVEGVLAEL